MTANAQNTLAEGASLVALQRYINCDWGETCVEDAKMNDLAVLSKEDRILAVYRDKNGKKFWIITEWDRSYTTILLPEDY